MSRPLRVAILAPISRAIAPLRQGGLEQVIQSLTEGLWDRGLGVTLFATGDSITKAPLAAVCPEGTAHLPPATATEWESLHVKHCLERSGSFDVIHNHCGACAVAMSDIAKCPVLTTLHDDPALDLVVYERFNGTSHYVALDDSDRHPSLSYLATVPYGIAMSAFALHELSEGYLLSFGPIRHNSGTAEAIAFAKAVRRRLVIVGEIAEQHFYDEAVDPALTDLIEYIGDIAPQHRAQVLGGAAALLQLSPPAAAFDPVSIEAMACGTPLIAVNARGARSLISPGSNGVFFNSGQPPLEALNRCLRIDRGTVRESVQHRYQDTRMIDAYVTLYGQLAANE